MDRCSSKSGCRTTPRYGVEVRAVQKRTVMPRLVRHRELPSRQHRRCEDCPRERSSGGCAGASKVTPIGLAVLGSVSPSSLHGSRGCDLPAASEQWNVGSPRLGPNRADRAVRGAPTVVTRAHLRWGARRVRDWASRGVGLRYARVLRRPSLGRCAPCRSARPPRRGPFQRQAPREPVRWLSAAAALPATNALTCRPAVTPSCARGAKPFDYRQRTRAPNYCGGWWLLPL